MRRVFGLAFLATGCFGTPTPLAPSIGGSVGVPHHGVLTTAVELPVEGPGFVRYRKLGTTNWGNPRLVAAVTKAALRVSKELPGGWPLVVGDLSARGGGKVPRHQSHRNGRDVDLPFFVTTPGGAPVLSPGFVAIGPDGLGRLENAEEYVRIDLPREWLLVKSLLGSTDVNVQVLFCSHAIEALIVEYARARGEPAELVWQAETVLMQPSDSLIHDDHLHLRIACSPEETVTGCEGGGPHWEWLPELPSLKEDRAAIYEALWEDRIHEDEAQAHRTVPAGPERSVAE